MDKCIFYAKDKILIDEVITKSKDQIILEREEDVVGFMGLNIKRDVKTIRITLTKRTYSQDFGIHGDVRLKPQIHSYK